MRLSIFRQRVTYPNCSAVARQSAKKVRSPRNARWIWPVFAWALVSVSVVWPLMARLCAHGGEPLRSTRDGFPMLPGNRQPHQHRPPVIDERHLPRHYLTSCQVLGRVPAPTPIDA